MLITKDGSKQKEQTHLDMQYHDRTHSLHLSAVQFEIRIQP